MTHNFKFLVIALLGTMLFFFTACEKEEITIDNETNTHSLPYYASKIGSKELEENSLLMNKLSAIENINNNVSETAISKNIYIEEYGFYLDTDESNYIESIDGNYHSYTFPIVFLNEQENTGIKNLVLSYNQTVNDYDAYILAYDVTQEEKLFIYNNEFVDLTGKSYIQPLVNFNTDEILNSKLIYIDLESGTVTCWEVEMGSSSSTGWDNQIVGYTQVDCEFGSAVVSGTGTIGTTYGNDTGSNNFDYTFDGSDGGPYGGGWINDYSDPKGAAGINPNNNNVVTTPVISIKTFEQLQREKWVKTKFNWQQNTFLNNTHDIKEEIYNYLESQVTDDNATTYSQEAVDFAGELIDLASLESNQEEASKLVTLSIMFETSDDIFSEEFGQSILPFTTIGTANWPPDYPFANLSISTFLKYKKLRQLNPSWSRGTCIWYATKEMIHVGLDVFGMIPLIGEPADIINGVLYTIEGDTLNATLSYAGAVPVAGWAATGVKYAIKINEVAVIATKVKLVWKVAANGLIEFGSSSQLRKVLGLAVGNANQAHHLIPWASRNHDVIQKAAKSGSAFHMNEALNGIAVAAWRNQPNHNTYNNLIKTKLDNFTANNPNATPQECYDFVSDLIQDIRDWVISHPNSHLNDLVLP